MNDNAKPNGSPQNNRLLAITRVFGTDFSAHDTRLEADKLEPREAEAHAYEELRAIAKSCLKRFGQASLDNIDDLTQMLALRMIEKDVGSWVDPERGARGLLWVIARRIWHDHVHRWRYLTGIEIDRVPSGLSCLDHAAMQDDLVCLESCLMQLASNRIEVLTVKYGQLFQFTCPTNPSRFAADQKHLAETLSQLRSDFDRISENQKPDTQ